MESIIEQQLPPGWNLEWVVQEDGISPTLAPFFSGLDTVRYDATNKQLGIAATRNLALARTRGQIVRLLDHDDILLPGALASTIQQMQDGIHWTIGQADDLMPDGSRITWPSALEYGIIPAGRINDWAIENNGNWPIHCAGLSIRTATLRRIGGWGALPAEDDIFMLAALSELYDGYNEPSTTWLYRQHDNQTNRTQEWQNFSYTGRLIALQRVAAIRGHDTTNISVGPSVKTKRQLTSAKDETPMDQT